MTPFIPTRVERPIWRRFAPRFADRAAAHVRDGGLAAIVHDDDRVTVVLGVDHVGALLPLSEWALASIDRAATHAPVAGPAAGLRVATLDTEASHSVLDWCDRDAVHPGPVRAMDLDCIACSACCQEANVELEDGDVAAWRAAGRAELLDERLVLRDARGTLRLRMVDGRCGHLESRGTCAIYEWRPANCRAFPPGSEPCLAAREDTLDLRDDAADGDPGGIAP